MQHTSGPQRSADSWRFFQKTQHALALNRTTFTQQRHTMATNAIEILSSSDSDSEAQFNSDIEVLEIQKENQPPRRASANPNLQLGPFSDDSDFEPSIRQGGSNKTHQTNNTATFVKMEQPCNSGKDNACKSVYEIREGMEFPSFKNLETHADKYAADTGMRWSRSTSTKDRGPNKEFIVRRLLCQSYGTKRMKKGSKGVRRAGPSVKCGCTAAILVYEHKISKKCKVKKAQLLHSYPCAPGIKFTTHRICIN